METGQSKKIWTTKNLKIDLSTYKIETLIAVLLSYSCYKNSVSFEVIEFLSKFSVNIYENYESL